MIGAGYQLSLKRRLRHQLSGIEITAGRKASTESSPESCTKDSKYRDGHFIFAVLSISFCFLSFTVPFFIFQDATAVLIALKVRGSRQRYSHRHYVAEIHSTSRVLRIELSTQDTYWS